MRKLDSQVSERQNKDCTVATTSTTVPSTTSASPRSHSGYSTSFQLSKVGRRIYSRNSPSTATFFYSLLLALLIILPGGTVVCFPGTLLSSSSASSSPRRRTTSGVYSSGWAFEQLLTFAKMTATIRCNVVKLRSTGGLWVHSPQWPTGECCKLLDECGTVEHVVLPCNAFEHKAPMQAFIERYPKAKVWIAPGQYGPLGNCGTSLGRGGRTSMPYKVDGILGDTDDRSPRPSWLEEFDMSLLYVDLPKNAGPVSEVTFCHRPTKTLISTDAVVYIPPSPPDILSTYFDRDIIENDPTFWPRSVLQAVFLPLRSSTATKQDSGNELNSGDVSYPGYEALAGRLVRAPILRAVVDARASDAVRGWITEQTDGSWKYDRIISSHFASPIQASPLDVKSSFEYLFEDDVDKLQRSTTLPPITCRDWELLDSINQFIKKTNAGEPAIFPFQRGCIQLNE